MSEPFYRKEDARVLRRVHGDFDVFFHLFQCIQTTFYFSLRTLCVLLLHFSVVNCLHTVAPKESGVSPKIFLS